MRKVSFVADYIQSKHPNIYSEAVEFYDKVDRLYPDKKDLRKTMFYKDWKIRVARQQATPSASSTEDNTEEESPAATYRDNLQLRIQLNDYEQDTDHATETSEKTETHEQDTDHAAETSEKNEIYEQDTDHAAETLQTVMKETFEVDTINPSMLEELSPQLMEKIIEDLRNEPELKGIVTSIEEQISFEQEFQQLGMDLDIPELENWENWEIW